MTSFETILYFIKNNPQDAPPTPEVLHSMKELSSDELVSVMQKCVEFTHLPTLQALFTHASDLRDPQLKSIKNILIIEAIKQYQWDLVPLLIQNGFNINCHDNEKNTPLHIVIAVKEIYFEKPTFLNERKIVIEMLIEAGANINANNKNGQTPLIRAVKFRTELVETLLKYNPDVNAAEWGQTPLMASRDQSISRLLLSKGANIDLQNKQGNTALMQAIDAGAIGIQLLLVHSKANIFLQNGKKETALSIATKRGNKDLIKLLMKNGAQPSKENMEDRFKNLPKFTFFAPKALTQEGVLEESDDPCDCCKKSRSYLYVEPIFDKNGDDLEINVCPWCIADGKLAKKYKVGAHRIDMDPAQSISDEMALEEVQMRTPGFIGWQERQWLVHCHTPCAFLGRVGWKDIEKIISDIEFVDSGILHQDTAFLKSLDADGSPTGYLFKCIKCNKLLMDYDCD